MPAKALCLLTTALEPDPEALMLELQAWKSELEDCNPVRYHSLASGKVSEMLAKALLPSDKGLEVGARGL